MVKYYTTLYNILVHIMRLVKVILFVCHNYYYYWRYNMQTIVFNKCHNVKETVTSDKQQVAFTLSVCEVYTVIQYNYLI